jgi:uncharacterized protein YciI
MQFMITAYDGKDRDAGARRNAAREEHLEGVKRSIKEGRHLFAAAILDDDSKMIGSMMVVDYPSLEVLKNEWLNSEPYITGNVWQEIEIKPCKVPEFFLDKSLI